jgi:hypothetical protein
VQAPTPTMPTFPTSWYSPSYQGEMIAAGSEILLKGQSFFQNDAGFVRSAFLSSTGGMSTFGDFDGKTYNQGPAYYYFQIGDTQCDYFCPVTVEDQCADATSLCRFDILNNATYANSTTVFGLPTNLFTFDDYLGPIDMAQNAMWVLQGAAVPVYRWQRLTPFGTYEGNITQTYGGFQAGHSPDQSWTKIVPGTQYCQQGDESQCPDNAKVQRLHGLHAGSISKKAKK